MKRCQMRPPQDLPHLTEGNGSGGTVAAIDRRVAEQRVIGKQRLGGVAKAQAGIAAPRHRILAHRGRTS